MAKYEYNYFDKHRNPILPGYLVQVDGCSEPDKVYLTEENRLGTDATSKSWLKAGKAYPCMMGIYPFEGTVQGEDMIVDYCEVIYSEVKVLESSESL